MIIWCSKWLSLLALDSSRWLRSVGTCALRFVCGWILTWMMSVDTRKQMLGNDFVSTRSNSNPRRTIGNSTQSSARNNALMERLFGSEDVISQEEVKSSLFCRKMRLLSRMLATFKKQNAMSKSRCAEECSITLRKAASSGNGRPYPP